MNYIKWLKENLDEERFEHSLGVSEKATELAKSFGFDVEKARLAGLVHDCAKCLKKEKLNKIINENIVLEECEMINTKTFHAPVGAYIAENVLGIDDNDILSAIRWHTIGNKNMSDFDKIIFIADKIETRTRPKSMIAEIEPSLKYGLDKTMLACYKVTIKSLVDRNLKICINTIELYNELL